MVFDDFENTRPLAFPRLGFGVLGVDLRQAKGIAHVALHFVKESRDSLFSRNLPNAAVWCAVCLEYEPYQNIQKRSYIIKVDMLLSKDAESCRSKYNL